MNKVDSLNELKSELKDISNDDIAHILDLIIKLATIEYENYKQQK